MILINVPDPNLAIEYLRAFIDDESSFNELRDLIADKSYALSICCTKMAYSGTISMITANAKLMVMRGNKIDDVIDWVESLKNVDDIYTAPARLVGEQIAYEMQIRRAVELGI